TRSLPAVFAAKFAGGTPTRFAYASPGDSDMSCGSCRTLWHVERAHDVGVKIVFWIWSNVDVTVSHGDVFSAGRHVSFILSSSTTDGSAPTSVVRTVFLPFFHPAPARLKRTGRYTLIGTFDVQTFV